MRQPPALAYDIPERHIEGLITPARFPPAEGKGLYAVIGMRTQESNRRLRGLYSSGSYVTKPNRYGVRYARPIYDWQDGDVWKAISDFKWDYNHAYDVMFRMGLPRRALRIAPPTQTAAAINPLQLASRAWPQWFERVCRRLPGVRSAALFGRRAIEPSRRAGESWEAAFNRLCITTAPPWIADRARVGMTAALATHTNHSSAPFPEHLPCHKCNNLTASWKRLTEIMYGGDPFCLKQAFVPIIEPEFFREGAGKWDGKPSF